MISHIKYAKEHILECADDSSNIKMDLNFDKINYHSYFGWKSFLGLIFIFFLDFDESFDYKGDLSVKIDEKEYLYNDIHGKCEFIMHGMERYPDDIHYTIFDSSDELLFEFDSHIDSIVDGNIVHGNLTQIDLNFLNDSSFFHI